jgi:hypothetical protein
MQEYLGPIRELAAMFQLLWVAFLSGFSAPPTDQAMIENFQRNRSQFETLKEKLCGLSHHQIVMMNPEWAKPEISGPEREWYYERLRALGAKGVQVAPAPCSVWIEVWAVGLAGDGDYKKYRFGPPIDGPMVEALELDSVDRTSDGVRFYHRRIEGDWWIEFDHWQ